MASTRPLLAAALLLPALLLPACVEQDHKRLARVFLNGRTVEETLAPASMDFTFQIAGEPVESRDEFREALQWDVTLDRTSDIHQMHATPDTATVVFHETNDFARLLGHPGWDGTIVFSYDDLEHGGLITGALYEPSPNNPPIEPYLDAALPYLRANHAETLAKIYPGETLILDAEAARAWKRILTDWQAAGAPIDTQGLPPAPTPDDPASAITGS